MLELGARIRFACVGDPAVHAIRKQAPAPKSVPSKAMRARGVRVGATGSLLTLKHESAIRIQWAKNSLTAGMRPVRVESLLLLHKFKGAGTAYDAESLVPLTGAFGVLEGRLDVVAVVVALCGEDAGRIFS